YSAALAAMPHLVSRMRRERIRLWPFDSSDLRSVVCQQHRRYRASDAPGQIQDFEAIQYTGHGRLSEIPDALSVTEQKVVTLFRCCIREQMRGDVLGVRPARHRMR